MSQNRSAQVVRCLACREFISLDLANCRFCGVKVNPEKYVASLELENAVLSGFRRRKAWLEMAGGVGALIIGVVLLAFWLLKPGVALVAAGLVGIGAGLYDLLSENGWLERHSIAPGTAIGVGVAFVLGGGFLSYEVGQYLIRQRNPDLTKSEAEKRAEEVRRINERESALREAVLAAERKAVDIGQHATPDPKATGYRVGKMVILKKEVWHFDPIQEELPEDLRPARPEEVGTVVVISSNPIKIGTYLPPDRSKADQYEINAYKLETTVEVIDAATRTIVARKTFTTMPSDRVGVRDYDSHVEISQSDNDGGSAVGKRPVADILKFVLGLPKK